MKSFTIYLQSAVYDEEDRDREGLKWKDNDGDSDDDDKAEQNREWTVWTIMMGSQNLIQFNYMGEKKCLIMIYNLYFFFLYCCDRGDGVDEDEEDQKTDERRE